MPYCEVITTVKVPAETEMTLNHALTRVIENIPGKTERWVMTHIADEAKMAFAGTNDAPAAMITVKTFGTPEAQYYDVLTKAFCREVAPILGVSPERMYIVYEPIDHWGWNSKNF